MTLIADATALFAGAGLLQAGAAVDALKRFNRQSRPQLDALPPVSILKPLKGDEPLLEAALASFCTQSYPAFQLIFGVQDRNDPAIAVVERLQTLFPRLDIDMVIDETRHGGNGKIANLINMWSAAKHDIIVLADSDVHVTPHFLERVVTALALPEVGVVTALYAGFASGSSIAGRFGAAQDQPHLPPRRADRTDAWAAGLSWRGPRPAAIDPDPHRRPARVAAASGR